MQVVIYTNPRMPHQVDFGDALVDGFKRHGLDAVSTPDRAMKGDIRVVQGPWYAYAEAKKAERVLYLDRCFYGDARWNVSLGWLQPDGSRDFRHRDKTEPKGAPPLMREMKPYRGTCIVFGDYGRDMSEECKLARKEHQRCYFRPHPADTKEDSPFMTLRGELRTLLDFADVAIGHSSTVLVDAVLMGLHTTSTDPAHVIQDCEYRESWVKRLTWTQWSLEEVRAGDFWEHLCMS